MTDCINDVTEEKGPTNYASRGWKGQIKEINRKYSNPRLKMTPLVRVTLLALRIYLLLLVVILIYNFYTLVSK